MVDIFPIFLRRGLQRGLMGITSHHDKVAYRVGKYAGMSLRNVAYFLGKAFPCKLHRIFSQYGEHTGRGCIQSGKQPQQRSLARPIRAYQCNNPLLRDMQPKIFQNRLRSPHRRNAVKLKSRVHIPIQISLFRRSINCARIGAPMTAVIMLTGISLPDRERATVSANNSRAAPHIKESGATL